jgi:glycine C-acetyltransferase
MAVSLAFMSEELDRMKREGLYGNIRTLESAQGAYVKINGKEYLNLCSNNYLGFANDPKVREKTKNMIDKYGIGPGAVRTIAGTMDIHLELENKLAAFKGCEAAITFQSGFCANLAVIPTLMAEGDLIFSDSLNHASIIDACKLTKAKVIRYEHSDMNDLRAKLTENAGNQGKKMLITDGVFSMDGDIAKLPEIVKIAEEFGVIVAVDDAHGEGVIGKGGRGIVDHFNLHGKVDIEIGTMSKAFGVMGGLVAGSSILIDFLRQKARTNLFSSALTVPDVAANMAAIEIMEASDERVKKLWENGDFLKAGWKNAGFDVGNSETPITPVIIGEAQAAKDFSAKLFENGVFATAIVFPTVPRGTARVRAMVSAAHSKEDLEKGISLFVKVVKEMGVIK